MVLTNINFNTNWNNKFSANIFTTIRPKNRAKYFIGSLHYIVLNGSIQFKAKCISVSTYNLFLIPNEVLMTDTGLVPSQAHSLIVGFYAKHNIHDILFDVVVLKRLVE